MSNVGKTTIQIQSDSSQARRDYESFFRYVENGLKRLENVARDVDPLKTLSSKSQQQTTAIIQQFNQLGTKIEAVFRKISTSANGPLIPNSLTQQLQQMQSVLNSTEGKVKQSGSAFNELDGKIRVLTAQLQSASTGMGGFANSTDQLRGRMEIMRNLTDQYRQKLEQLREKHHAAAAAEGENAQSTLKYAEQIHRTTTEINRLEQSMNNAQNQLNQQTSFLSRFTNGMENMGQRMQNFGMSMTTTFGTSTYVLGRFFKSAVEESMNFEQQMADIKAVSGATSAEMGQLSQLAVKYGEATKYSSVQAGKGIEELIKAGVSLKDIIGGGLEGALNLATAGELDLGEAAQIASTALNAFKSDNLSVTDAANLLAGAANASATNVKEMQYGLSMVSAVAAGVGLSFKDTSTALALFAQNGLRGSDAGTSLKTMLANLIPKSDQAYQMFKELGLMTIDTQKAMQFLGEKGIQPATNSFKDIQTALAEYAAKQAGVKVGSEKAEKAFQKLASSTGIMQNAFFDANGNLKGMADIAEIVQTSMKGLTAEQRQSYMYTLFGSDAIRAANILYKEGASGIKNMYGEMSKVTALDVANTKMATTKGQIEQLSGAYDTLKKSIGDALLPTIRNVVSAFQGLVDWFNGLDKSTQETIAGTGLLVVALMGLAGVIGILTLAVGVLLANPISLAIVGVIAGLGLLGTAVMGISNNVKQATDDYSKFGGTVSEGTRQAAGAYVDLKDKAINNMILLKTKTGEEAQNAANQTIEIFKEMTNKVVQELDSKKNGFDKMFAELMQVVPENTKENLERVHKAVTDGIEAEKQAAIEAGKILEEGIKKFNGDVSKMPRDFAQKFNDALTVLDQNTKVFFQKSKEIAQLTNQISEGGTLTYAAAQKNFESMNKAYSDGIDGLKKKTKEWRESIEKDTSIDPAKRKTALDSIELYEKQHMSQLQRTRLEGYNALVGHMKQEDMQKLAHNAKMIEIEDKGWAEKIKVALARGEDASEVFKRYLEETEKSEKAYQDKSLEYESKYMSAKAQSLGLYMQELQKGNDSSRVLAENIARNIDGKLKVDLGPAGQYTVNTFLEKMKKGELDSESIATAHANKLKDVYKVDLSQSGIDSMKNWIEGTKSQDTGQVRQFLGNKLQGDTVIDLGIYGKMTIDTWIGGLQQGTLGFDTVFQYFHDQLKSGMKVDSSEEGINNVQTLINGMKIGAIAVPEAAKLIGLDIKNNTKVDLGEDGQFTVATLVQGLQNGSINAEIAAKAIAELVKNGAKIDLTQAGIDGTQSFGNAMGSEEQKSFVKSKGAEVANAAHEGFNTINGDPFGIKGGNGVADGIMSQNGHIKGSAMDAIANAHDGFNTINGNPAGQKGGSGVSDGIISQNGHIKGSAMDVINSAHDGFNTINGSPFGARGGNDFSKSLEGTSGQAKSAGKEVSSKAEDGLKSADTLSLGQHFAAGFSKGIEDGGSIAGSAARALASTAYEAAKRWLEVRSPSRKVKREIGFHFGTGFAGGIDSSSNVVIAAAKNIAKSAFSALYNAADTDSIGDFLYSAFDNMSNMAGNTMQRFEAFGDKVSSVMDNIKDALSQHISSNINLGVSAASVKQTLAQIPSVLSQNFIPSSNFSIPAPAFGNIPVATAMKKQQEQIWNMNPGIQQSQQSIDGQEVNIDLTQPIVVNIDGKSIFEIVEKYRVRNEKIKSMQGR